MNRYIVITFPESQKLTEQNGFNENAYAVCDEKGLDTFGPEAYFVDEDWYHQVTGTLSEEQMWAFVDKVCFDNDDFVPGVEYEFDEPVALPELSINAGDMLAVRFILDENENLSITCANETEYSIHCFDAKDAYDIARAINDGSFHDYDD